MDERAVRKARNETWFRDVNERLELHAGLRAGPPPTFEIVCECDREACTERIEVGFAAYERVRRDSTAFIVVPGHADTEIEHVVARRDAYEIVSKLGAAAAVAELSDPRNGA